LLICAKDLLNVNVAAAGFIETDMTQRLSRKERQQIVRSALGQLVDSTDVANAIEFLLGEKARNITGTAVDAGNTA